jgi:hypothetical protein
VYKKTRHPWIYTLFSSCLSPETQDNQHDFINHGIKAVRAGNDSAHDFTSLTIYTITVTLHNIISYQTKPHKLYTAVLGGK